MQEETEKIIQRKDELLKEALTWLIACEWEIPLGIIADIEKELGLGQPPTVKTRGLGIVS